MSTPDCPAWSPSPPVASQGASLPRTEPEAVGLSSARLQRLTHRMREAVEVGHLPGAVVLVARRGMVAYEEAFGLRQPATRAPMRSDAIFRIASMTKPITSMAAMMLAEEGRLLLRTPLKELIPAFANQQVLAEDGSLQPLVRDITVHDLLRHTSGLPYGFTGVHPLKQQYLKHKVSDVSISNAEHVERAARLPLHYQPGTAWEYGISTDVLGRVVEVVSGQGLDRFVADRITGPLGLRDTGFYAPASAADRAAYPQAEGPDHVVPAVPDPLSEWAFKSGGGGMVSTASDYARLCQLWLNGGQLDGVRLLSRKTLETMTSNHLPPGTRMGEEMHFFGSTSPSPEYGNGFGLGFLVRLEKGMNPVPASPGTYSWSGIYGTSFWVDPKEELFAILMMQNIERRSEYLILMRHLVYQALND